MKIKQLKDGESPHIKIDLSFIEDESWRALIMEWLEHKAETKQPHGITVAKRAYHQLIKESGGNKELADEIVEYCIQAVTKSGKPYAALWNPYKNEYGRNNNQGSRQGNSFDRTAAYGNKVTSGRGTITPKEVAENSERYLQAIADQLD